MSESSSKWMEMAMERIHLSSIVLREKRVLEKRAKPSRYSQAFKGIYWNTRTLTDACSKINIAYKTLWFSGCSTYGCDQHIDPQIKFPACGYKKHKKYLSKKAFICSPILLFTICPLLVYQLAHLMISLQTGLMIKVHSSLSLLPLIR